jgi:hypothetical protein
MRRFIVGLCALAAIESIDATAAVADNSAKFAAETRKGHAEAAGAARMVACLGDALNDESSGSYLTIADYPPYAPPVAGRRVFICGDAIPPFIPWSDRNGAGQHRR